MGWFQIFPVTYVEAMPEPSPRELQEEAQEEARVFASLGDHIIYIIGVIIN